MMHKSAIQRMETIYEKYLYHFYFFMLLFQSCSSIVNESNNSASDNKIISQTTTSTTTTTTTTTIKKMPSIIGKWYYNPDDDRYFYEFKSNGTLRYGYYVNYGSSFSISPYFTVMGGTWKYINDEKTKFSVGWKDYLDAWYDIISEDDEKIVLKRDCSESAPVGPGLWSGDNVLLKSAKTVTYSVDEEIKGIIGTWYYDQSKDGQYIVFNVDKTFSCRYYYYVGSSSLVSHLNRWTTGKGEWYYNSKTKLIAITMNSEVTYKYEIANLTSENLTLKLAENNPSGSSLYIKIDSNGKQLYKK